MRPLTVVETGVDAVPDILAACRGWMKLHASKVDGGLYLANAKGQFFFPIYRAWPMDMDLEDSLCDLDMLMAVEHKGIHVLMLLAPPRDVADVLDFAMFALSEGE